MFERYNEEARRVIFFSRYEAAQTGSPFIETNHLLLGIIRQSPRLFRELEIASVEALGEECRKAIGPPMSKISTSVDLPLSKESMRVLAYAAEEAERLQSKVLGLEHLALGLLRERNTTAEILTRHGITIEKVRALRALEGPPPASPFMAFPAVQVEFVCDQELLGMPSDASRALWPRMGETVVLGDGEHRHTYIVANITYCYDRLEGRQIRLSKVVVTLKRSRSKSPTH
jgi:hypothetical protein